MEDENKPSPPPVDYSLPPSAPQTFVAPPQTGQPDAVNQIIPYKNPKALIAYYCAVFALVPCFTPILGPLAIVLGFLGLKDIKQQPQLPGKAHALIGIILGGFMTLALLALIVFVVLASKKS